MEQRVRYYQSDGVGTRSPTQVGQNNPFANVPERPYLNPVPIANAVITTVDASLFVM